MVDPLFHGNGNNPEKNDPEDSLENLHSNIHICAGETIHPESYKLLKRILTRSTDFEEGIRSIAKEIETLKEFGVDYSSLRSVGKLLSSVLTLQKKFNIQSNDLDPLVILRQHADEVERVLADTKQSFKDHLGYDFSLSAKKNEDKETALQYGMFITSLIEYKLSFFIAHDEAKYCTDISGFISTIASPSETYKMPVDKIDKMSKKQRKQFLKEHIEEIEEALIKPEEYIKHYTTLSPHLLRSIIAELDRLRADYVFDAKPTSMSQDLLISILQNFEDTSLACCSEYDSMDIKQDGHEIIITWETPAVSAKSIVKNQDKLKASLQPTKKLLNELGGDLLCTVDNHEIRMTIVCPKQEEPEISFDEQTPGDNIFYSSYGAATILPFITPLKLTILSDPSDETKRYDLFIDKDLINNELRRKELIAVLNNINKINQNHSLESISLMAVEEQKAAVKIQYQSQGIDGVISRDGDDGALLVMAPSQFADPIVLEKLSTITKSANCSMLNLPKTNSVSETQKLLEALQRAIDMSHLQTDKTLIVTLDTPLKILQEVIIRDSDDNLVTRGFFLEKYGRFCGRCHSPELTKKVLIALDEIAGFDGKRATKLCDIHDAETFAAHILNGLREHEIYTSEGFRSFLNKIISPSTTPKEKQLPHNGSILGMILDETMKSMSFEVKYQVLRHKILNGMVWISEHFGQSIGIDAPSSTETNVEISYKNKIIG